MYFHHHLHHLCGEVTTTSEGQVLFTRCSTTGVEGIWSPGEEGTFEQWEKEHHLAHDRHQRERDRAERARFLRATAIHIYRTTEPGSPLRRGIGPYL